MQKIVILFQFLSVFLFVKPLFGENRCSFLFQTTLITLENARAWLPSQKAAILKDRIVYFIDGQGNLYKRNTLDNRVEQIHVLDSVKAVVSHQGSLLVLQSNGTLSILYKKKGLYRTFQMGTGIKQIVSSGRDFLAVTEAGDMQVRLSKPGEEGFVVKSFIKEEKRALESKEAAQKKSDGRLPFGAIPYVGIFFVVSAVNVRDNHLPIPNVLEWGLAMENTGARGVSSLLQKEGQIFVKYQNGSQRAYEDLGVTWESKGRDFFYNEKIPLHSETGLEVTSFNSGKKYPISGIEIRKNVNQFYATVQYTIVIGSHKGWFGSRMKEHTLEFPLPWGFLAPYINGNHQVAVMDLIRDLIIHIPRNFDDSSWSDSVF